MRWAYVFTGALVVTLLLVPTERATAQPAPETPPAQDARPRRITPPLKPPPPDPRARAASPDAVRATPAPRTPPPPPARNAATLTKKAQKPPKRTSGWFPKLSVGVTTSLAHNHQIPGVDNGISFTLGAVLHGELAFVHGRKRWVTTLGIVNAHAKTPVLDPFIKTADLFDLKSMFDYRLKGKMKKVILWAGVQLTAPMFPGNLVPAADTDLTLTDIAGTVTTDLAQANHSFRLTPAFTPLFFRQMAGGSALAYESELATLRLDIGAASQQVWASGWTPADDKTTPELELVGLRDFQQLGVLTGFMIFGKVNKRMSYAIISEFMYPLVTSFDTPLEGFDLMSIDLTFKFSLKVAKWVSVDYLLSVKRIPLIVDQWQLTNNLVLAITADVM